MVAMSFLPELLGVRTAAPLVALMTLTTEVSLLLRYRAELNWRDIYPLLLASILGIPAGIWALRDLEEKWVMVALGLVIMGYAVYALLNLKLPELRHKAWAYATGLVAGLLGGAFNTSGPPVVLYGNCRRWQPAEFKSNLQGFFVVNSLLVVASRFLSGDVTREVWNFYLWVIPAILLGLLASGLLDRFMSPETFRRIVLVLLVVMGLRMILTA